MNTGQNIVINRHSRIQANPRITLQVEPDRWGFLYDPDIDFTLGINPESVFLWKRLENKSTVKEIVENIKKNYSNVPEQIENDVLDLVKGLMNIGFVSISNIKSSAGE